MRRWIVIAILIVAIAFFKAPIEQILRVGTGITAKRLCSAAFVSNRWSHIIVDASNAAALVPADVGQYLFLPISLSVNREQKQVTASLLWITQTASFVDESRGCTLVPSSSRLSSEALRRRKSIDPTIISGSHHIWNPDDLLTAHCDSEANGVDCDGVHAALDWMFRKNDSKYNTFAAVVVRDGKLLAERYDDGITDRTPLLLWSMTKSYLNAMFGVAVHDGLINLKEPINAVEWTRSSNDRRAAINVDQVMRMSSGLDHRDAYGLLDPAPKMLFCEHSTGEFAANIPHGVDADNDWKYSSPATNLLSHKLRTKFRNDDAYHRFPFEKLFEPLHMHHTTLEMDPNGTYVMSSFGYSSARDVARLAQLYLTNGQVGSKQLFDADWVKYTSTPTRHSNGTYGAHVWLNTQQHNYPSLPADTILFSGFEQQSTVIIPSARLVVIRLGLTLWHDVTAERADTNVFASKILHATTTKK